MRREVPAGVPSVVSTCQRHRRPFQGVSITMSSYDNPPPLFAWTRPANATFGEKTLQTVRKQHEVRRPSAPSGTCQTRQNRETTTQTEDQKEPKIEIISQRPTKSSVDCGVQTKAVCSHASQTSLVDHFSGSTVKELLSSQPTSSKSSHKSIKRPSTASRKNSNSKEVVIYPPDSTPETLIGVHSAKEMTDYWKWLHWYSAWQMHYQEEDPAESYRRPQSTAKYQATAKTKPTRSPSSWWVDVSLKKAASDCGGSRPLEQVTPRAAKSLPAPKKPPNEAFVAEGCAPVAPIPVRKTSGDDSKTRKSIPQSTGDTALTLEELAH
ncbi:hypothetical protein Ae201684P_021362 [Aphanomyces euteiches]|uniref:Uncharacterized protein n=1 Tax=Aphanomyces euteiches TaxID=100861 RepID=A0A6G0X7B4_9STRA|nr:hypothetical protein Ae201684_007854 [Aphanomyces euteiches]KAH9067198.1 hypothetical protein Ae201684P_021362 [Aphanomyces euteiches]KAH9142785.1 hypothetical protein AeRB84_013164 [Aphanomyces euteiches]